jgi:hypothetical protein
VTTEVSPEPEHAPSPEDDSDISSTCADAGTDEELDELTATAENKRKMSTTDASSDATPEWTREEDRILCVRKSEAKS